MDGDGSVNYEEFVNMIFRGVSGTGCHREDSYRLHCPLVYLLPLGPGRPSAGGPRISIRMDRRAVTSSGVVNISHLALHLQRSARRGPDMSL